jgi:hypothetical protein
MTCTTSKTRRGGASLCTSFATSARPNTAVSSSCGWVH